MNRRKLIVSLTGILAISLLLAGCDSNSTGTATTPPNQSEPSQPLPAEAERGRENPGK